MPAPLFKIHVCGGGVPSSHPSLGLSVFSFFLFLSMTQRYQVVHRKEEFRSGKRQNRICSWPCRDALPTPVPLSPPQAQTPDASLEAACPHHRSRRPVSLREHLCVSSAKCSPRRPSHSPSSQPHPPTPPRPRRWVLREIPPLPTLRSSGSRYSLSSSSSSSAP